jgi:hypothetical protein
MTNPQATCDCVCHSHHAPSKCECFIYDGTKTHPQGTCAQGHMPHTMACICLDGCVCHQATCPDTNSLGHDRTTCSRPHSNPVPCEEGCEGDTLHKIAGDCKPSAPGAKAREILHLWKHNKPGEQRRKLEDLIAGALDAAREEGDTNGQLKGFDKGYRRGLEEAAKVAWDYQDPLIQEQKDVAVTARDIARQIRQLEEGK